MTQAIRFRGAINRTRVLAIAGVRTRRVLRTRLAIAALVLALMPWLLVDSDSLVARMTSLAEFSLVGLTVIGAGALSDELGSGEYAVASSHDCSPLDILIGQTVASLGLTALLVLLQLPIALSGTEVLNVGPILLSFAWLAALLTSWLGMLLLLATMLEGKANAVAMVGVLAVVPLLVDGGLMHRLPPAVAEMTRDVLQVVPQVKHATTMFRATLGGHAAPTSVPAVLLLSPVFYFALATVRLHRLEPAGRLTQ